MMIEQQIAEFFKDNSTLSKESLTLYHTHYKVKSYKYDSSKNKHELVIASNYHGNKKNYKLEKVGELHSDLQKCLQNKEEIVYFWGDEGLESSSLFSFLGHGYQ
jgi:hypothetical protein